MSKLIIVRHGKSEWNALGLWTGSTDVHLNEEGKAEAKATGEQLRNIHIDKAYCSDMIRACETLDIIKSVLNLKDLPTVTNPALDERDYGVFTGKNKWQVKEQMGEQEFENLRRGWNCHVPGGETLEDVYCRVVPFYEKEILPDLKAGKNVIVVAHGNSLRALAKYLENLDEDGVCRLEIGIAEALIYDVDKDGKITSKEIRGENKDRGKI